MARAKRDLTRQEIVDATMRLLADEDETTLTMRRLAKACGVTPMAIYHHVASKEELIDLALNQLILSALEGLPSQTRDWRSALIELVAAFRDAFIANPGAGRIFVRRAVVGAGTARMTEEMMRCLRQGGLDGAALAEAADAITLAILGSIVNELTRPTEIRKKLIGHLPAAETPHMTRYMADYAERDPRERFLKSLGWLLDGVERSRV